MHKNNIKNIKYPYRQRAARKFFNLIIFMKLIRSPKASASYTKGIVNKLITNNSPTDIRSTFHKNQFITVIKAGGFKHNVHHRSLKLSLPIFCTGLSRNSIILRLPVLISAVTFIPGLIGICFPSISMSFLSSVRMAG